MKPSKITFTYYTPDYTSPQVHKTVIILSIALTKNKQVGKTKQIDTKTIKQCWFQGKRGMEQWDPRKSNRDLRPEKKEGSSLFILKQELNLEFWREGLL